MPIFLLFAAVTATAVLLTLCGDPNARFEPGEHLSGGAASTQRADKNAFSMPAANLSPSQRMDFFVGNAFFRGSWKAAQPDGRQGGRTGLGPLFNSDACQSCHIKDGRGFPPAEGSDAPAISSLVRLSIPAGPEQATVIEHLGIVPEPTYGGQLQDVAIEGHAPEGRVLLRYEQHIVTLADGLSVYLRQPVLTITKLGYGPMHPQTQTSLRVAPPMIGLGLLEAIRDSDLEQNASRQARDGGAVRGELNQVWDEVQARTRIGRFGWKAGQPTVDQQNAHAFASDMGLTSSLLPADDCTERQSSCRQAQQAKPDVSDKIREQVLFYSRTLAVPARRDAEAPLVLEGKAVFHDAGCAACHRPSYVTGEHSLPELSSQRIFPYTDLLLHDMGEGLADHRSEFRANGRQWRTPPLWGLGLTATVSGHTQLLHDGRARNLLEAILWHGGEAKEARDAVVSMDREQREALLTFLQSL